MMFFKICCVLVYRDDILIFSHSLDKHTQHVRLVLRHLLENKLYVKPDRCEFHSPSVSFLGYIAAQGQLLPDPSKIQAAMEWLTPTSCKQMQHFLGFAYFYQFIRSYIKVIASLTKLTSINSPYSGQQSF